MAIRQIVVSDIGGKELAEGKVAKVRVSGHPALGQRVVELDIGVDEAKKFQDNASDYVYLEVDIPGNSPQEVILDVPSFEGVFGNADVKNVLDSARESGDVGKPSAPGRQRRRRSTSSASTAPATKRDYTDIENIGLEHRGRVTEKEAEMVRASLDRANINRAREGQAPIDPSDPKMIKRYGFQ